MSSDFEAIKCVLVIVLLPVIVAVRFYLERRRGGKSLQTPVSSARPIPSLAVKQRKHSKPILQEERAYADVLPFVRIYQGTWSVGAVFIAVYLIYGWLTGIVVMNGWRSLGTYLIGLFVFTAVFLWVSLSLCRMSAPFGFIMLFICVGGVGVLIFSLLTQGFFLVLRFISGPSPSPDWFWLIYLIVIILFSLPVGYLYYLGLRAGWRFVSCEEDTRRIVSEMDPISLLPSGWFSRLLTMPIPGKHLTRNRTLTATLFIVSGVAFSSFALLAIPSALLIPLELIGTKSAKASGLSTFPFIVGGLTIASLLVGLAARAGARRLMISSIRESQEYDPRPPILFLRSFRDDQVALSPPRIPVFGRLVNLFQRKGSLDVILLEEGTAYGPVVAIGQPGEPIPPYGASRGYFHGRNWKGAVAKLADDSRCIVICLDRTEGVMWELDHLLARGHGPKTLFLMNPGTREVEKNKALVQVVTSWMPNKPRELLLNHDEPVIGFFFDEGKYAKVGVSAQFSEASYLLMVRWFLRTAMDGCLQPN